MHHVEIRCGVPRTDRTSTIAAPRHPSAPHSWGSMGGREGDQTKFEVGAVETLPEGPELRRDPQWLWNSTY